MEPTYHSSTMANSNFHASQSTLDTIFSNELSWEEQSSPYIVDASTSQLNELSWALSDTFFEQAVACYDLPKECLRRSSEASTTAYTTAVNLDANSIQNLSPDCVSRRQATPTSLSCSDRSSDIRACTPECGSSSRIFADAGTVPQRQMGRSGPNQSDPLARSASGTSTEGQRTTRIPHNMVERKYRHGLNAQLERLRRAVPVLQQSDNGDGTSQLKASKSSVITAAVDYIKTVTLERDMLLDENNKISDAKGSRGSKRRRVDPASVSAVSRVL